MLERFGPDAPVELSVAGGEPRVAVDTEYHVVRIAQEAVANAVRHAAGLADTRRRSPFPNGTDPPARHRRRSRDSTARRRGRSAGLVGMRERASILKGELLVQSVPGQGTEVSLEVPSRLP